MSNAIPVIRKRFIALVEKPNESVKVRQYKGLPPELTGGVDDRETLAWPRVLIIEAKPDGVFLFRFSEDSTCVGDTWHLTIEDAQHQAEAEYGKHLTQWQDIPQSIDDPVSYAIGKSRR
jgi:hypothetical protein